MSHLAPEPELRLPDQYEVFISYSHDNPEHIEAVRALSDRLRGEGIDCVLDQYEHSPPEGWPRWMDGKIHGSRYVVMVCTEPYNLRVMGREVEGVGHGVRWEGNLIYQHIYDAGTRNVKFIPVVLRSSDRAHVPTPLRGATIYCLESEKDYTDFVDRLAEIPKSKPGLGARKALPKKEVKTNPAMYVTGPIDVDLWNSAGWKAVAYGVSPDGPPVLCLAFRNASAARKIFEGWHVRYGERDSDEELRISIIEGDIPGEEPGYSVHVNIDTEVFVRRIKAVGFEASPDFVVQIGRVHRMNPPADSTNLARFKEEYRRHKVYWLMPGVIDAAEKVQLIPELQIFKGRIVFKHVSELHENDIDSVVLAEKKN